MQYIKNSKTFQGVLMYKSFFFFKHFPVTRWKSCSVVIFLHSSKLLGNILTPTLEIYISIIIAY